MTKARKIGSEDASPGRATRRSAVRARANYSGRIGGNVQTARPSMSEPLRRTGGKTASPSTTSSLVRKFGVWHDSRRVSGPLSESPPMSLQASRVPRARPKKFGDWPTSGANQSPEDVPGPDQLLLLLSALLRSLLLRRLLLCRHWRITSSSVSKNWAVGSPLATMSFGRRTARPWRPRRRAPESAPWPCIISKHASCHEVAR